METDIAQHTSNDSKVFDEAYFQSGLNMTFTMGEGRTPSNISIDRIDPSKGYTIENTQLVCMAVNQIKSDLSIEDMLKYCKAIIDNSENAKKWN